jgi:hypothetical protein
MAARGLPGTLEPAGLLGGLILAIAVVRADVTSLSATFAASGAWNCGGGLGGPPRAGLLLGAGSSAGVSAGVLLLRKAAWPAGLLGGLILAIAVISAEVTSLSATLAASGAWNCGGGLGRPRLGLLPGDAALDMPTALTSPLTKAPAMPNSSALSERRGATTLSPAFAGEALSEPDCCS